MMQVTLRTKCTVLSSVLTYWDYSSKAPSCRDLIILTTLSSTEKHIYLLIVFFVLNGICRSKCLRANLSIDFSNGIHMFCSSSNDMGPVSSPYIDHKNYVLHKLGATELCTCPSRSDVPGRDLFEICCAHRNDVFQFIDCVVRT